MRRHKLFRRAPRDMMVYRSLGNGTVRTTGGANIPLPIWPDGRWCAEAALFIEGAARRNLSRFSNGGTVVAYMHQISPLIRFCWRKKLAFASLDDDAFTEFIDELKIEGGPSEPLRYANAVLDIGRRSLSFLEFVGELHGIDGFLYGGPGRIAAEKRTIAVGASRANQKRLVTYWHHHSFPPRLETRRRKPIGIDYISRLRRAAVSCKSGAFIKQRRLVMLRLLEATGGRRSEVVRITIKDIEDALLSNGPFLKLYSAKRPGETEGAAPHRYVKVTFNDLDYVRRYIEQFRAPIVDRMLGGVGDHGFLLIAFNTAGRLTDGVVTNELRRLRVEAKIKGKAHPHLFRHRFMTIRMKNLIEAHKITSKNEFEVLFKLEGFKKEVAESTGLKSLASLDVYLDWAFIELAGLEGDFRKHVDLARVAASVESSLPEIEALRDLLSPEEFTEELMRRYWALVKDVGGAMRPRERSRGSQQLYDVTQKVVQT
ncbi:site-specific integrase [Burkholderia stagnalis]|uniref:site-specific integrase n=1 Tax=Burkholderia stagnalis TaxID=1503054 RepID=UPI000F560D9B|nr:site-specific integrase [Burkholderia stagnalis]RQQ01584.1 site-specific integrase [Burkholderia stagnalis]RQQ25878.1 site-specific integrase [Burkholderia stagnalis]RQQ28543.1 site-specific integrase [Burkholderia stagnalis]RQQ46198.1 site-specific integrase [Burkholderia stagnalis]RQX95671.1 site-specific integrase [Burkholderia stagnalis]